MKNDLRFDFEINRTDNTVNVVRGFDAPLERVWRAWTTSEMLDQWWAPKPFKAKTKDMNFVPGGRWLYAMIGPDGNEHWSRADFQTIDDRRSYSYDDAFCDSEGSITNDIAGSHWHISFEAAGDHTTVSITIMHKSAEDLEQILQMGFKEGFSMGLGNLDELLAGK